MSDLDKLEKQYFKSMFNSDGIPIIDNYESMTFTELESSLKNIYLYSEPWDGTDQAQFYIPYPSFLESVKEWSESNFYRQHKASVMYLELLEWIED